MPARTAASLVSLVVLVSAGPLFAQSPASSNAEAPTVLHFTKPADTIFPAEPDGVLKKTQATPAAPSQGMMIFEAAPAAVTTPAIPAAQPSNSPKPAAAMPPAEFQTRQPFLTSTPEPSERPYSGANRLETDWVRPVFYQAPMAGSRSTDAGEPLEYHLQLEPPGLQRLIRLDSEKQLNERMRQEARERPVPERIQFPEEPVISREKYAGRTFPAMAMRVEPNYLCHERLYFEERNAERYGWDLGIVQPFVSAGAFFWDVATLPYHLGTDPCRFYDSSAGKCLPGDPVPYLLYPPELSVQGALTEAGTAFVLLAIFP
jgi:hypothetical protein